MTELESLRAKLRAREGKPGYEANIREIKERIAALEAMEESANS